jgi:PAS domain S-box-containing protein
VAGESVLVIDNRAEPRQCLIETVLKPGGYATLESDTFEAGLKLALEQSPDLIVLSAQVVPPGEFKSLKKLASDQPIVVLLIVMSPADRLSADRQVADAWSAGVRDILFEPFAPGEALHAIERALTEIRLRRERDGLADQLAQARRQMEWQLQELNAIYTVGKTATALPDLERVLAQVVEAATYMARGEEGSLMLVDDPSGRLYLRASKHLDQPAAGGLHILVEDALLDRVLKFGRPVMMAGQDWHRANPSHPAKALLYVPLKVPLDRIIGVLGISNEVSERTFTERDMFLLSALGDYAAIAIENARLFAAVESDRGTLDAVLRGTEDAVILLDLDKQVLLCNPAARRAFGIKATDIVGRPLHQVSQSQVLQDLFEHLPIVGRPLRTEVQLTDGRTLQAQISAIEAVGYAAVMQDITHLKELDRVKSEFVSVVSHDLRSPLTTIRGYVDLLPRVGPLTPQQAEFVNRMGKSMKTVTDLIGDLLDIGRVEAGLDQEAAPCRIDKVLRRAVDAVQMSIYEKQHELTLDIAPDLPLVMGSVRRLEQVAINLLINAIKYTPDGGKIKATLKAEGEYVMLSVADNGIGIPLEDQPYIFSKFYRVQNEATANIIGSGLGLSIVKTVVDKHGGRVWVESAPGQGSTFSVLLPAKQ